MRSECDNGCASAACAEVLAVFEACRQCACLVCGCRACAGPDAEQFSKQCQVLQRLPSAAATLASYLQHRHFQPVRAAWLLRAQSAAP